MSCVPSVWAVILGPFCAWLAPVIVIGLVVRVAGGKGGKR